MGSLRRAKILNIRGYWQGLHSCLMGDPIPCVPFPLGIGEGEGEELERGAMPLLDTPLGGRGR